MGPMRTIFPDLLERLAEDGEVKTKKDTHHGKNATAYMSVDESGREIRSTLTVGS